MAEDKKAELLCDDVTFLISRNIDGDLNRSETIQLHRHIATCEQCRASMSQLSELESSMQNLSTVYQEASLSPDFSQSIHDTLSKKKKQTNITDKTTSLFQYWRKWRFFSDNLKPAFGILGAFVVLSLSLLFWQQGMFEQAPSYQRFVVHDIPLRTAVDTVAWNQQHTILPSQTIRLIIRESHSNPYFFKVSSLNSVRFSVDHNQMVGKTNGFQELQLNGIRYITLKNPRADDFVHIRNHGAHPISVKTFSYGPQAIQADFR